MSVAEPTRERLLDAAGEIFADKGKEAAGVREIYRQAGIKNIAAVNYYFGDKDQLYIEAVRRAGQVMEQRVPYPEWAPGTPPAVKLRDFIATFVARVTQDHAPGWCGRLIMREMFQPTAACLEFVRAFVRPNFDLLMTILDEFLPADVPVVKRHQIAFSVIGQVLHYRLSRTCTILLVGDKEFRGYDAARLTEHITEFTLAALEGAKP